MIALPPSLNYCHHAHILDDANPEIVVARYLEEVNCSTKKLGRL